MTGRKKATIAIVVAVVIIVLIITFLIINKDEEKTNSEKSSSKNNTTTTVQASKPTTPREESTTTVLSLDGVSISLSTPFEGQGFQNSPVTVRAIIEGATSGTCNLKFTRSGASSIELEAPIISGPTYFTCEGFDVEASRFTEKGEWELELKVNSNDGKSGSEKRMITVS